MLEFGDVIYRPCISYHGKKNFINTQIVKEIIHKPEGDYIFSYDVFRQGWTDRVSDLNKNIFTDKKEAENALQFMVKTR